MAIFRKNKRQFGIRSHRNLFVALFLFFLLCSSAIVSLILNANAQLVPARSVEIFSEHSNFENSEPGSWKVTKTAEWTGIGKARITFEVNSVAKYDDSKKLDVVMVIDDSGSMEGDKMGQVKTDAADLVNTLLSDLANRVALVSFDSDAMIRSDFTNDKAVLLNQINQISTQGCTNYYSGLLKAEEILSDYTEQDGRRLVLLFLTDGYPNEQVPNEIAEYKALKNAHPYMTINGIQYEMGETVLQPIINISDYQYIADINSLNNVLFTATAAPYYYEDFVISDFVNDEYWIVAGLEAIEASLGGTGLSYDGSTPKITWDLSSVYRSGGTAVLTIDIDLKQEFSGVEGLLLPTNKREEIETILPDTSPEEKIIQDTPVLKDNYNVVYDTNKPVSCDVVGAVPDNATYIIFTTVPISTNELSCAGYEFKGWRVATSGVTRINDDYFLMPGKDVTIKAIWTKPDISKSMDGAPHVRATATFSQGQTFAMKIRVLSGQTGGNYGSENTTITAFRKANTLSSTVDTSDNKFIVSDNNSRVPIYAWFDEGVIYYYTDADDIYLNSSCSYMFGVLRKLDDISGLAYVNTSRVTSMSNMFVGDGSLFDLSPLSDWDVSNVTNMSHALGGGLIATDFSPLANWDVSNVTNMSYMLSHIKATNLDALRDWDTGNVTDMSYMFLYAKSIEDISGVANWKTSKVRNMRGMFWENKISSLDALATKMVDGEIRWDVSNVEDMGNMFIYTDLTNINAVGTWDTGKVKNMGSVFNGTDIADLGALQNWNTSEVTNMESIFYGCSNITDINALRNWDISNVTYMSSMFGYTGITSLEPLTDWDTSKATTMRALFKRTPITDVGPLNNWETSNVQSMSEMFYETKIINIDALATKTVDDVVRWDVSNVTDMSGMFEHITTLEDINAVNTWNTSKVTNMNRLFSRSGMLTDFTALKDWSTSKVTNMATMFWSTGFNDVGVISGWDVSNVTDMSWMFVSTKLTNLGNPNSSNQNERGFSDWDTSKVTNMSNMFDGVKLTNIDALSNWNTSKVTNMKEMFDGTDITSLAPLATKSVDGVVRWDVSNVTNMSNMFYSADIVNVDALSDWNVSSVTNMSSMFYGNENLEDVSGINSWDVSNVIDMSKMFYGDSNIMDLSPLENWTVRSAANKSNMFYRIPDSIARPAWYTE